MAKKSPFEIHHRVGIGRGYTIKLTLTDEAGDPVNPSEVVYAVNFPGGKVSIESDGDDISISGGVVTIRVLSTHTDGEPEGTYAHDALMVIDGDARDLLFGTITLVPRQAALLS